MGAPKSQWQRSLVTAHALEQLAAEGLLPLAEENQWCIATMDPRPRPSPGEFVVFTAFLERGLGFPTSEFFQRVLDFYGLKLHDLTPNHSPPCLLRNSLRGLLRVRRILPVVAVDLPRQAGEPRRHVTLGRLELPDSQRH